jgi:hydrogenase maturation protease
VSRTLVGGVGYHDLRDFSVGPLLVHALREEPWPDGVVVEDLSYNPVKVVHRLKDEDPPFDRLLVLGAVRRGRRPGSVVAYRWDRALPDPEEIQNRMAEAVTGVVGLDNLLVVTTALGAMPGQVLVVEVEPEVEAVGERLSPAVARGAEHTRRLVGLLLRGGPGTPLLAEAPLGGLTTTDGHGDEHDIA